MAAPPFPSTAKYDFTELKKLVGGITALKTSEGEHGADPGFEKKYKRAVEMLPTDIEYIKANIESLANVKRAAFLLKQLIDDATKKEADDFKKGTPNLHKLLQIIAKLKLLVPPKTRDEEFAPNQLESPFVISEEKKFSSRDIVAELLCLRCDQWGMDGLLNSYNGDLNDDLNNIHKLCLLCFSAFDDNFDAVTKESTVSKSLKIKKNILIHWWLAEGLIHLHRGLIATPAPPNLTTYHSDPDTNQDPLNSNSIPDPNPDPSPPQDPETVEETGELILKLLKEKGFINPVMKAGRESSRVEMHPFVHSFVTALAKRAGFFDFSREDGKLTPSFGLSQRACLVKPPDKLSSCKVWEKYIEERIKLRRFETVHTLFNVNEPIIDIKPEWFSRMTNLTILHLGSWRTDDPMEHIEFEDTKFMDGLKTMVKMRLFSLQGVSTVMKLSDSVCKLENLLILNLKECHNLEELPVEIGCLKSLTHLDITNCHLLTKLPKGISLLLELEVLKGFVIYVPPGHKEVRNQIKQECTLKDLGKLQKLRELSIVVNVPAFPKDDDVQVFQEMRKLRKLKISWEKSLEESGSGASNANVGHQWSLSGFNEGRAQPKYLLDQIYKLKLWGFPGETAPYWLHPKQLKNIEELSIKGGEKLERVPGDVDCDGAKDKIWWENIKTLRLKDLPKLNSKMTWLEFRWMFPKLEYLQLQLDKFGCGHQGKLPYFPCDKEGVWKNW